MILRVVSQSAVRLKGGVRVSREEEVEEWKGCGGRTVAIRDREGLSQTPKLDVSSKI